MVKFHNIQWRNFLSTGNNPTTIQLDESPTTLVVGENGSGKSTMIDALCFCLFGKPFRKVNKGQLVNSVNGKQCEVETTFSVGNDSYRVKRTIKSMKTTTGDFTIEKNGESLAKQSVAETQEHLEKYILGMNLTSFTQIVVLGSSSYTPFMELKTPERRDMIEELLDLKKFSIMNVLLKDKLSKNKDELQQCENKIDVCKEKIGLYEKHIASIEEQQQNREAKINQQIESIQHKIQETERKKSDCEKELELINGKIGDENSDEYTEKRNKLNEHRNRLLREKQMAEKEVEFYHNKEICPTCSQRLDPEVRREKIAESKNTVKKNEETIQQINSKVDSLDKRIEQLIELRNEYNRLESYVSNCYSDIKSFEKDIKNYQEQLNESIQDASEYEQSLQEQNDKLKKLEKLYNKLSKEKDDLNYCKQLLKDDGIKAKIIKQYVPVINRLVNQYLQKLDFFVSFELDENFNETIKSRYRDAFSYSNFSEGEKARINIALMMAWRDVARMKNSNSCSLLVMDEVFDSSLDAVGADGLGKILRNLEDNNVFVISHKKEGIIDMFNNVIEFQKNKNFSEMKVLE